MSKRKMKTIKRKKYKRIKIHRDTFNFRGVAKGEDYIIKLQAVEKLATREQKDYAKRVAKKYGVTLKTYKELINLKTYHDYKTNKTKLITKTTLNQLAKRSYQIYTGYYDYKKQRNYLIQWDKQLEDNVTATTLNKFRAIIDNEMQYLIYADLKEINMFYVTLSGSKKSKLRTEGQSMYQERRLQITEIINNAYKEMQRRLKITNKVK